MSELQQLAKKGLDRMSRLASPIFGEIPLDFLMRGDLHDCPYVPGRSALEEFFIANELHPELYHDLMDRYFRRSGTVLYRPVCPDCRECRPIRVPVADFVPSKSQRRVLRRNEDVQIRITRLRGTREKLSIYKDYLASQHNGRSDTAREDFARFLYTSCVDTVELEYRVRGRLVAGSIVDACARSLSSVYAYFDPAFSSRSLGTFSALQEIRLCSQMNIPYYYIGFYVADCPSMRYKARFKPHEIMTPGCEWSPAD